MKPEDVTPALARKIADALVEKLHKEHGMPTTPEAIAETRQRLLEAPMEREPRWT